MVAQVNVRARRGAAQAFDGALGPGRVQSEVGLGAMTTFKTGGQAEWFFDTSIPDEVQRAVCISHELGLGVTLLGGGSNVLVGERGVRGLVIRLRHGVVEYVDPGRVRVGAGVSLNGLVRWMARRGLAGLEQWAGTPGTLGGAVHGNAHFQGRLIGDQVTRVGLLDAAGRATTVDSDAMEFGYDTSRIQQTGEVALWVEFDVTTGDPAQLRTAARESLAFRKRTQPLSSRSAGCIFRNPSPGSDGLPDDLPASAGALIDRAGLKGTAVGHARVSSVHANFIVSDGKARPREIRELIERCRTAVHERFGVWLRDEIRYLGDF